jgi:hypothetical protein
MGIRCRSRTSRSCEAMAVMYWKCGTLASRVGLCPGPAEARPASRAKRGTAKRKQPRPVLRVEAAWLDTALSRPTWRPSMFPDGRSVPVWIVARLSPWAYAPQEQSPAEQPGSRKGFSQTKLCYAFWHSPSLCNRNPSDRSLCQRFCTGGLFSSATSIISARLECASSCGTHRALYLRSLYCTGVQLTRWYSR